MKFITSIFILLLITSCSAAKTGVNNKSEDSMAIYIDDNTYPLETELNTADELMEEVDSYAAMAELTIDDTPPDPETETSYLPEIAEFQSMFDHSAWDILLKKYVSEDGRVDYQGFLYSRSELGDYISSLGESVPDSSWPEEDILAYWINAYNALTVDLIIRNYPLKSIKDIKDPWKQKLWELGNKYYDLDEIEHDILRKMNEPRIHFAIVCASLSCPKLQNQAFTSETLDSQLDTATREFLSDPSKNQISSDEIKLSKLFRWFSSDFEQNGSLIDFLNKHTEVEISENAKKSFLDYSWDLND